MSADRGFLGGPTTTAILSIHRGVFFRRERDRLGHPGDNYGGASTLTLELACRCTHLVARQTSKDFEGIALGTGTESTKTEGRGMRDKTKTWLSADQFEGGLGTTILGTRPDDDFWDGSFFERLEVPRPPLISSKL